MMREIIGKTRSGREIELFCGRVSRVLLVGGIHAREHLTCDLVKMLGEEGDVDFVPCANPDGRAVFFGKERPRIPFDGDVATWKSNAYGVDLNVNFDAGWGTGKFNVRTPGAANYIGPCPMSEPETTAICDLIRRKKYDVVVSYHMLGEEVYWGFGDNYRFYKEAKTYADFLGYRLKKSVGSAGGLKDWYCKNFGGLGLTVEVGESAWGHPCPADKLGEIMAKHRGSVALLNRIGGEIARKNDARSDQTSKDRL